MKQLLVISSAPLIVKNGKYFAYSPYEKEMNIWAKYSDEILFCCPIWNEDKNLLNSEIQFDIAKVIPLKEFNIKSVSSIFTAFVYSFINFYIICKAIMNANHIHMRCPGNMGLIASFAQIFFPKKNKTAKYAGNWDSKAKQPFTYKLQRWILSNTFLTKNMQVLVYGEWPNQSKNIKSFFTATYRENEKKIVKQRDFYNKINFIFVGTLSIGKQPIYAIKLVEKLKAKGRNVQLSIYGSGSENDVLEAYIKNNKLNDFIFLKGNANKEAMKSVYQNSHFLILPSKSEGWPKVVAEAMFFGCLPIATSVSCVPNMLDYGKRGILLKEEINFDVLQIDELLSNQDLYINMANAAISWSQNYTIDKFESEIEKLL